LKKGSKQHGEIILRRKDFYTKVRSRDRRALSEEASAGTLKERDLLKKEAFSGARKKVSLLISSKIKKD